MRSFITFSQFLYFRATDRRLLPCLLALVLLLSAGYIYLVHNSIYNLKAREVAIEKSVELETEIAVLETRSISLLSEINLELAAASGFVELKQEPLFAVKSESVRLSLAGGYER